MGADELAARVIVAGPVPVGGIVLLSGIDMDPDVLSDSVERLNEVVGHTDWLLILAPNAGSLEVIGPEERALLTGR